MFGPDAKGPVLQVDLGDVKAAWQLFSALSGSQRAIDREYLARSCKPDADVDAVAYRTMMLTALVRHAKQELAPWMNNEGHLDDAVFYAGAKVGMEWIPTGVTLDSFPLDFAEFLRLCGEYKATSPAP